MLMQISSLILKSFNYKTIFNLYLIKLKLKIAIKFKIKMKFLIFLYILNCGSGLVTKSSSISNDAKISFDLVDISIDIEEDDAIIHLDAFKSTSNDEILLKNETSDYSKLKWVAIGNPKFMMTPNRKNKTLKSIFHFTPERFYAYIGMLTIKQKEAIANAIKNKYGVTVLLEQIVNLILSRFECNLYFESENQKLFIKGEVNQFRSFPLQINFNAFSNSFERKMFQERLNRNDADYESDLEFQCDIAAGGTENKKNELKINLAQLNQFQVSENLFGPASSVFVTRNQLSNLALEMYSNLNIIEEYEMPMYQFKDEFVDVIINQAATNAFTHVPIDEALQSLSRYSTNFEKDLKPDEIKKDLSKVFKIDKINSQEHIKINDEFSNALKKESNDKGSASIKGSYGLLEIDASASAELKKLQDTANTGKSLKDQLKILNNENQNDIQWEINGDKIVPKTLKVAKLNKASFSKSLVFSRVRKQSFDALFQRKITLSTTTFNVFSPTVYSYPIGTIVSVTANIVTKYFDAFGRGFDKYLGWFLCDGRNETPVLSGTFTYNNFIKKIHGEWEWGIVIDDGPLSNQTLNQNFTNLHLSSCGLYQSSIPVLFKKCLVIFYN